MTEFGDTLNKAIEDKKEKVKVESTKIDNLVWKYKNGSEVRLMDMNEAELKKCYVHAWEMLYSKSNIQPGKCTIKKIIARTYENINAELFMRYIFHECNIDGLKTNKDLFDYIGTMKTQNGFKDSDSANKLFNGIPVVFEKVTIDRLLSACFDKLEVINRKIVSDKFILTQGIWLTAEEKKDLTEFDENGKIRPYMDVIRERLILNDVKLRIDRKGLSYNEFRSLVRLDKSPKISSLPTNTLMLLRDKILLLLDYDLNYHIDKWNIIFDNITRVAEYKNITLTDVNQE